MRCLPIMKTSSHALKAPHAGRLDKILAEALPDYSRARLQALIVKGHVTLNGRIITTPSCRLKGGEALGVDLPEAEAATPQAENIPLSILYEDKHLLVINKPAGMVVHPAAGHGKGTLVNALLAHCGDSLSGIGGVKRPGIVHRLDKDTSGLMVVAKTDAAHQGLSAQFAGHRLARVYVALAWGLPKNSSGIIEGAIGRSASTSRQARKKMAVRAGGKHATTHYKVEEHYGLLASRIACTLETGRTHQIRVHLAHMGCSVVGDPVYGRAKGSKSALVRGGTKSKEEARAFIENFPRQALHAAALSFTHPKTGKTLRFEAPLPADMLALIKAFKKVTL